MKAFTKAWKNACRAAGCPGRIPHDLRRTAVRNMVRVGIPERVAMKLTGHKTRRCSSDNNIVSDGDLTQQPHACCALDVEVNASGLQEPAPFGFSLNRNRPAGTPDAKL